MKEIKTNIAITGGNGYIGNQLIDTFKLQNKYKINILTRKKINIIEDNNITYIQGNLLIPKTLNSLMKPGDTLIHLAYMWNESIENNIKATENIIKECIRCGVSRIVHVSTAAVVGRVNNLNVDETTTCNPSSTYGKTKLAIENLLIKHCSTNKIDLVIIRPTSVYGINGAPLLKLCKNLHQGNWVINYLRACLFGTRSMNLVHIENLIDAIELVINHKQNFNNEILIVSEDDAYENNYICVEKIIKKELKIKDYPIGLIKIPICVLNFILKIKNRNMINAESRFSSSKIKNKYKFRFNREFIDGVQEYGRWYLKKMEP